ncbi:MAG: hypothetical protein GY757_35530, partial [bacterium]|nr:hypothetical protein [bacterium]
DGNIEYLGRMDNQVKIRGFRIELGEIENTLRKQQEIKEAVVIDRQDTNNEKYLCAYYVAEKGAGPETSETPKNQQSTIREKLAEKLPAYMIPAYFTEVEKMPLTTTGKLDRKALPEPGIPTGKDYVAPRNKREKLLVRLFFDALAAAEEQIGIDDNFFHLGGHSLKAATLISKIYRELSIDVPLAVLFEKNTVRELTGYIDTAKKEHYQTIESGEKKEYYPVSSAQKRLYIVQQMDRDSTGYNQPNIMLMYGNPGKERLETIFWKLIQKHESLRTTFILKEDKPVQVVRGYGDITFSIEYIDLEEDKRTNESLIGATLKIKELKGNNLKDEVQPIEPLKRETSGEDEGKPEERIIKQFIRPFDLARGPLLRVSVVKISAERTLLLTDTHHIISDGVS